MMGTNKIQIEFQTTPRNMGLIFGVPIVLASIVSFGGGFIFGTRQSEFETRERLRKLESVGAVKYYNPNTGEEISRMALGLIIRDLRSKR